MAINTTDLQKIREDWRRPGLVKQHSVKAVKEALDGLWTFTDIKHGDIKKGQGDIVIVNLKPLQNEYSLIDYLGYTRFIDRVEVTGIYTNIYWGKEFFSENIKRINKSKPL